MKWRIYFTCLDVVAFNRSSQRRLLIKVLIISAICRQVITVYSSENMCIRKNAAYSTTWRNELSGPDR